MLYIECSDRFNKYEFIKMINNLGHYAKPMSNGFIFDDELLNMPFYEMPHWLYMNRKWLKNHSSKW